MKLAPVLSDFPELGKAYEFPQTHMDDFPLGSSAGQPHRLG